LLALTDKVGLGGFLQRTDGGRLEALLTEPQMRHNLLHQALKRQLMGDNIKLNAVLIVSMRTLRISSPVDI